MYLSFPNDLDVVEFTVYMAAKLRSAILGSNHVADRTYVGLALALGVFVTTLIAYALGIFSASGGLVWIPFHAAAVGMIAGFWIGYSRRGLLFAWMVTYTSLLGYHADHAVSELSGLTEQLRYFVRLDSLMFLAVEGIVLGTIAFILGALTRLGVRYGL